MSTITLDGLNEEEFRRSIEMRLRHDLAGAALERLRGLLAPFAQPGGILPERFLTVSAGDLNLYGWDGIADALRRHDRPGRPVSALSVAFGWPGEEPQQPDADGRLSPMVETSYFTDDAFPFSASGREDLLDGYSYHGCTWADDCEARESTLSLGGVDDLHGALALLETRLLASDAPDDDEIRAGSLGSCLLSVLLYQAVSERIARDGLPRPLCVMAGSNGVYPYFDAPVIGIPEDVRKAAEAAEEEEVVDRGVPGPRYSSLLVAGIPRAKKRAVLVLEESEEEMAVRIAHLRGIHHREEPPVPELSAPAPEPERPAPHDGDTAISPAPGGPLMSKKPSGQSWDFRDLLGPLRDAEPSLPDSPLSAPSGPDSRGPEPTVVEPPLPVPPQAEKPPVPDLPFETARFAEPEPDDDEPIAELPEPTFAPPPPRDVDPAPAALPRPRFPSQAPVAPGFTLLEPSLQDRLESLLSPQVAPDPRLTETALEPPAPPVAELVVEASETVPDMGPAWPLGIGWLEDDSAPAPVETEAPQTRLGLLSRLRAWLRRGR
ncbi:MAG: hypothetical protein JSR28_11825 [Proteobacteria bacterium]|nr:hypothetical protein [Pseudomonadota bacterium]